MHLPDFIVTFHRLHLISSNCKLALDYINRHYILFSRFITSYQSSWNVSARNCAKNMPPVFSTLLRNAHWSVHCMYFRKTSRNKRARHSSQQTCADKQAKTHAEISYLKRFEAVTSLQRHESVSPLPRDSKTNGRLSSLAGDEIRYFVKVISPRKVSFRRVIAPAPFPPTAMALHAVRARETTGERKGVGRAHLMKAQRLVLPEEISHFGLRRLWTEGWG